MDVGRAFTYVTEDPAWVKKLLIGGCILLASTILSIVIIGLVGFCLLLGYYVEVIRRVNAGVPSPLPDWDDLGSYISRGFVAAVGAIVWSLPFIALISFGSVVDAVMNNGGGAVVLIGSLCIGVPILIALNILVIPLAVARFAVSGEFGSMFQFGAIFAQVRRGFVPLVIAWVVSLAATAVAYFGVIACVVGVFFTLYYAYLVHAFLIGEMYRQVESGAPASQPAF